LSPRGGYANLKLMRLFLFWLGWLIDQLNAAVAVVISAQREVLLIRRAEREDDPWSGQVAFPGGRLKQGETPLGCALREFEEEVGVPSSLLRFLFDLDVVSPSNQKELKVKPFVFSSTVKFQPEPNRDEVADARWFPLDKFEKSSFTVNGRVLEAYLVDDWVVWGMSKRILDTLFKTLKGLSGVQA
jgi:8-oxo-dGTP diphosphatase